MSPFVEPISCIEVTEVIEGLIDGELGATETAVVEAHLESSFQCVRSDAHLMKRSMHVGKCVEETARDEGAGGSGGEARVASLCTAITARDRGQPAFGCYHSPGGCTALIALLRKRGLWFFCALLFVK